MAFPPTVSPSSTQHYNSRRELAKRQANAMSSWLSVYLAALLGWGSYCQLYTHRVGENNDVGDNIQTIMKLTFKRLIKIFITSIETRFGVPVLAGRPASYLDASNGCQDNRCRGSFGDLITPLPQDKGELCRQRSKHCKRNNYSKAHLKDVRDVASYLRLSAVNFETAQAAVNAMKLNGTIIFLHFGANQTR